MKFNKFILGGVVFCPVGAMAAGADFNMAAQLLSAARNGNTRLVQNLINSGADVNYVDSTGVSVVCTAVMNNDMRAVQILQMYGADASQCDRQIKNYRARNQNADDTGMFSGLSSSHKLLLGVVGAGAVIGGLLWLTDAFDGGNDNDSGTGSGSHSGNTPGGGTGDDDAVNPSLVVPYSPAYLATDGTINPNANVSGDNWANTIGKTDFDWLRGLPATDSNYMQNYLLMSHGYDLFANSYYGQYIFRNETTKVPLLMSGVAAEVHGGTPALVALITANGIDNSSGSLVRAGGIPVADSVMGGVSYVDKYKNYNNSGCNGTNCVGTENTDFDLSGNGTAVENSAATAKDNNIAKIVAGWAAGGRSGDLYGFVPYGSLAVYRIGDGASGIYNYRAMYDALRLSPTPDVIANVVQNTNSLTSSGYDTIDGFSNSAGGATSSNFQTRIAYWYGTGQGAYADDLFSRYNVGSPIVVNSVGGYNVANYPSGVDATFENYAPVVYSDKIDKNFISVVAVQHVLGTAAATTVAQYGNGVGSLFGKVQLSTWNDGGTNVYRSRMCGVAGSGVGGVDPWCFAAPGDNSEYAVAAMSGAVASLKKAFGYMSNQTIFNLLALTADGPYLAKNPSGDWYSVDDLVAFLKSKYTMSVQKDALTGTAYLDAFKQVFGYGLINLERAVTPNEKIYYYANGDIVSGNSLFWDSFRASGVRMTNVFGARGVVVPVAAYDVLSSQDSELSVARVWNNEFMLSDGVAHGLYLGDTLGELKTHDVANTVSFGNLQFGFARHEKLYDDNMSGVDNLSIAWANDRYGLKSEYQHYLTDGESRFWGHANPVLGLVSNAVSTGAELKSGKFAIAMRGFVGNITTDGLLENDPVVSNNFAAAKLGDASGAESGIKFSDEKLSIVSNVGTMHESNTVLGAAGYGFFDLNGADTNYIDSVARYAFDENIDLSLRATFAWTHVGDIANGIVLGLDELKSNAFAAGARFGNFDFGVSVPLALTGGVMRYSFADFDVDENGALIVNYLGERDIDLTPEKREYRFNASYRHKFGDWTDGALGFIYRVNPNNTDAFGNESIFMMKLSHRLGI